jgi:peroxiredoxin
MTKEFPNDPVIPPGGTPARLLIRASGLFRHYGLGISHFRQDVTSPLAKFRAPFHISRMSLTPSTMLPLGTAAPDFRLPDTNGKTVSLTDFKGQTALLVVFMCNHCPYVQHIRAGLAQLAHDYLPRGVAMVGINSNDVANFPEDSPAKMAAEVKAAGYLFPYLYDESQAVAKAYHAACTPDIFLFDRGRRLVYRGQFDASRPGNGIPVTGKDVRAALDAVLAGKTTSEFQSPSIGCNIKWKAGNEPGHS